jgi:hypothetical protein
MNVSVSLVADLNNVLMPASMIAFGVGLVRFVGADSRRRCLGSRAGAFVPQPE